MTRSSRGRSTARKFTPNLNNYFDPDVLGDYRSSLAPLGPPTRSSVGAAPAPRRLRQPQFLDPLSRPADLTLITYAEPGDHGRLEQYMVMPQYTPLPSRERRWR